MEFIALREGLADPFAELCVIRAGEESIRERLVSIDHTKQANHSSLTVRRPGPSRPSGRQGATIRHRMASFTGSRLAGL
jgi:hypothetical protein